MNGDVWYGLFSIMQECERYRYGEPSYDMTLDHIYDTAAAVLAHLQDDDFQDVP